MRPSPLSGVWVSKLFLHGDIGSTYLPTYLPYLTILNIRPSLRVESRTLSRYVVV